MAQISSQVGSIRGTQAEAILGTTASSKSKPSVLRLNSINLRHPKRVYLISRNEGLPVIFSYYSCWYLFLLYYKWALIRSAIRGLVKVADADLEGELRRAMKSGDDYASASKPQIDWDDPAARDGLVDSRAKDAYACLAVLDGRELAEKVGEAARLLATVVGQDLEQDDSGAFRIARKVAKDRVISVVDPEARHGHKTQARSFDGYKGHVAMDPDTEIITDTAVTPGNAGDGSVAEDLISDLLEGAPSVLDDSPETTPSDGQVVDSEEAVDGDTRDEDASPTV